MIHRGSDISKQLEPADYMSRNTSGAACTTKLEELDSSNFIIMYESESWFKYKDPYDFFGLERPYEQVQSLMDDELFGNFGSQDNYASIFEEDIPQDRSNRNQQNLDDGFLVQGNAINPFTSNDDYESEQLRKAIELSWQDQLGVNNYMDIPDIPLNPGNNSEEEKS